MGRPAQGGAADWLFHDGYNERFEWDAGSKSGHVSVSLVSQNSDGGIFGFLRDDFIFHVHDIQVTEAFRSVAFGSFNPHTLVLEHHVFNMSQVIQGGAHVVIQSYTPPPPFAFGECNWCITPSKPSNSSGSQPNFPSLLPLTRVPTIWPAVNTTLCGVVAFAGDYIPVNSSMSGVGCGRGGVGSGLNAGTLAFHQFVESKWFLHTW